MIMQIKTEKELLAAMGKMQAQIVELQKQNSALVNGNKIDDSKDEILDKINKHVTIEFVNKLYKARK